MLIAVAVASVIGIPLGIWSGRSPKVERVLRPLLDTIQTMPAYFYLLPLVIFFGIGVATALIATVIFALPPLIRLTRSGSARVPASSLEVADRVRRHHEAGPAEDPGAAREAQRSCSGSTRRS